MKFKKKISLYVLLILSIVILSSVNVFSWNSQLNKMQSLTSGSQGYRHMYFSVFGGLLKAGVAPQRANHFFEMAKVAFKKAYRPGN